MNPNPQRLAARSTPTARCACRASVASAALVAITASVTAGSAWSQSAGTLLGRIGATQIKPEADNGGTLSAPSFANTRAVVKANTQPTGGLTYMVTDHVAIDVPLSLGFKHDIEGAGAIAGVGKIGEVKALPVTLFVQYRLLNASSPIRPYIGVGPTYAKFYKARSTLALTSLTGGTPANPTTISIDSKFTFSAQLGLSVNITPAIFIDAHIVKTPLKTRTTLSTGQTLDGKLDPTTVGLAVGMKF